jgi:hypothetical protein
MIESIKYLFRGEITKFLKMPSRHWPIAESSLREFIKVAGIALNG